MIFVIYYGVILQRNYRSVNAFFSIISTELVMTYQQANSMVNLFGKQWLTDCERLFFYAIVGIRTNVS